MAVVIGSDYDNRIRVPILDAVVNPQQLSDVAAARMCVESKGDSSTMR
jgi:hypothetical protein